MVKKLSFKKARATQKTSKPKIKVKRAPPTIKRRIATAVAVAALGASTVTVLEVNPSFLRKARQNINVNEVAKMKYSKNTSRIASQNPNLIKETVNSYNQNAKTGQIFFYDGKKVKAIYFDQTKLNNISKIIPDAEKAKLDSLISEKIRRVEATAKENATLGRKIQNRVGEIDYSKYLLSLTPKELNNAFPEAEITVRRALEKTNPDILKTIESKNKKGIYNNIIYNTILFGVNGGIFWAKGKKRKLPAQK